MQTSGRPCRFQREPSPRGAVFPAEMVVWGNRAVERLRSALLALLLLGGSGLALAACEERKGPFERAGEAADEAVGDAGRAVDDAID